MKKKFGRTWGHLPSFWRLMSWILKKIISNFKLINSNHSTQNATLLSSTVCSVDQFKVFHRGRSSRPIGHDALARSILRVVRSFEKQKCLFFGPASIYEKKFGLRWSHLPPFWRSTSWILKKIISNFKLINSNHSTQNATLLHSTVCSVDQFKVFHRGRSSRPIGRDALARSILRVIRSFEKQKCLFFGPASVYEKKIWA